jgi:hypothetical protein
MARLVEAYSSLEMEPLRQSASKRASYALEDGTRVRSLEVCFLMNWAGNSFVFWFLSAQAR